MRYCCYNLGHFYRYCTRFKFKGLIMKNSTNHPCTCVSTSATPKSSTVSMSSSSTSSDIGLSYTTYTDQSHIEEVDQTKKPLVFLHGLFGAKGNLRSVSKHLSDGGRKVITFDARNHGDSDHRPELNYVCMADDLHGLINDLQLEQPVVMGHSMGGKTAMTFALSKPDILSALIVGDVAPAPSPNHNELLMYAEAMKRVKIPPGTSLVLGRKVAKTQLSPIITNRGILEFLLMNLKEFENGRIKWRVNIDSFLNNSSDIMDFPLLDAAPFMKPVLFIFGENSDHYKSLDEGKIKALFPSSHIIALTGAGHFVHADKPLDFVQVVQEFLVSVDPL